MPLLILSIVTSTSTILCTLAAAPVALRCRHAIVETAGRALVFDAPVSTNMTRLLETINPSMYRLVFAGDIVVTTTVFLSLGTGRRLPHLFNPLYFFCSLLFTSEC